MTEIFGYFFLIGIGKRALAACAVIGLLLLARLFLRRAPRKIAYLLWILALVTLLFPILPEIPVETPLVPENSVFEMPIQIEAAAGQDGPTVILPSGGVIVGGMSEDGADTAGSMPSAVTVCSVIWLCGVLSVCAVLLVERIRLSRSLVGAVRVKNGEDRRRIWLADGIRSAFVLGIIRPKIYLPSGCTEEETKLLLLHESVHIRRWDNFWRLLGIVCLAVYWFHPLVWLGFRLAVSDMEASCDEAVLRQSGDDTGARSDYAEMLVRFSAKKRTRRLLPTAFGEEGTKERIKNILTKKKTTVFTVLAVVILAAAALCLMLIRPTAAEKQVEVSEAQAFLNTFTEENVESVIVEWGDFGSLVLEEGKPGMNMALSCLHRMNVGEQTSDSETLYRPCSFLVTLKNGESHTVVCYGEYCEIDGTRYTVPGGTVSEQNENGETVFYDAGIAALYAKEQKKTEKEQARFEEEQKQAAAEQADVSEGQALLNSFTTETVDEIYVRYAPCGTRELREKKEIEQCLSDLRQFSIGEKSSFSQNLYGTAPIFTVVLKNGETHSIVPELPYCTIDGQRYTMPLDAGRIVEQYEASEFYRDIPAGKELISSFSTDTVTSVYVELEGYWHLNLSDSAKIGKVISILQALPFGEKAEDSKINYLTDEWCVFQITMKNGITYAVVCTKEYCETQNGVIFLNYEHPETAVAVSRHPDIEAWFLKEYPNLEEERVLAAKERQTAAEEQARLKKEQKKAEEQARLEEEQRKNGGRAGAA